MHDIYNRGVWLWDGISLYPYTMLECSTVAQWCNYVEGEEAHASSIFRKAVPLKINLPHPLIIVGTGLGILLIHSYGSIRLVKGL